MTWLEAVPVALTVTAWLLVPGLPITYALGTRGVAAWATAPLVSVTLIALTAVVTAKLGIAWSLPLVIGVAAGLAVAGGVAAVLVRGRPWARREPDPRLVTVAAAVGLLPAVLLGALTIVRGFGQPENLSQTYDALFHYNAVALILDTREASSLTLSGFGVPTTTFYPAAWHDLASLVVMTTGATIPVATNMLATVVAVLVWPLSCLLLARQVFGRSPAALAITAVLSIGFSACPWGLLGFGVLWPNALGMALAPAGLAVVLSLAGLAKDDALGKGRAWLLLPVTLAATAFAHPGVLFSLVVFAIFPVGQALLGRFWRLHRAGRTARGAAEIVGVLAVAGAVWYWTATTSHPAFANVRTSFWAPFETPARAVGEVLLNATNGRNALWLLSALVLVGVVASIRIVEQRWLVAAHAASGFLYLLTASLNRPDTQKFTGYWYNDSFRLAAMLPVTGVPLAVAGILLIATRITARTARTADEPDGTPAWRRIVASRWLAGSAAALAVILTAVLVAATKGMYQPDRTSRLAGPYLSPPPGDVLVDAGQRAFFDRVKEHVPAGAVVANNPWDGSGMLWALAGRRTLFPHFTVPTSPEQWYLAQNLYAAPVDPKVCQAADQLNVEYLLIGNAKFWPWDPRRHDYPGLADPKAGHGFQLVVSDGERKLYRITACGTGKSAP